MAVSIEKPKEYTMEHTPAAIAYAPPWQLRGRGLKDAIRHDRLVKEAIKKNLREIIGQENIIQSDGVRRITIPMRYLEQYRFKLCSPQSGAGQGAGKVRQTLKSLDVLKGPLTCISR